MFTETDIQALGELLNRIPWVSTAEKIFLHQFFVELKKLLPEPEPEPEPTPEEKDVPEPNETPAQRFDNPLIGY